MDNGQQRRREQVAELEKLLRGVSENELREAGLEAIRKSLAKEPVASGAPTFRRPMWCKMLARVLDTTVFEGNLRPESNAERVLWDWEPGNDRNDVRLLAFFEWLVATGLAVPRTAHHSALTEAGERAVQRDHPLRPRTLRRLRDECDDKFEDAVGRMEDAAACLERDLPRPAVVLLGLAFEELITVVSQCLGVSPERDASKRQEKLRRKIEGLPDDEARKNALVALNTADSIRSRRNDAAHDAASEWDRGEVEELLMAGILAFPKLATYEPKGSI